MTSRHIYARLVRCHPSRFREQFEDEMLATFEDACCEQNPVSLLVDAFLSLLRQWLCRPGNWGRVRHLAPSELRRQSAALHRRAWRINLAFLAACVVGALGLSVRTRPGNAMSANDVVTVSVLVLFGAIGYPRYKNGTVTITQQHEALSILSDPRRSNLVRQRDSLRIWAGGYSAGFGNPVVMLPFYLAFSLVVTLLLWFFRGTTAWVVDPLGISTRIAAFPAMLVLGYFASRLNGFAADALQQEIDAIDLNQRKN